MPAGSESPPFCPLNHKAPERRTALQLSVPLGSLYKMTIWVSFRPYLHPPLLPSKPEPLSRHCLIVPSINELCSCALSPRLQSFKFFTEGRNQGMAGLPTEPWSSGSGVRACLWIQEVCSFLVQMPSLCLWEPPLYYYLHLLPLLLTLNKPSSPWRVSELQSSLGKGINAAVLPDPVLPHSSFSITLAGWDTKLSLPLTFPV